MTIRALKGGHSELSVLGFNVIMIFPVPGYLIRNSIKLSSTLLAIGQYGFHSSVFSIGLIVEYDSTALTRGGFE